MPSASDVVLEIELQSQVSPNEAFKRKSGMTISHNKVSLFFELPRGLMC
jgi:hypothetical protein